MKKQFKLTAVILSLSLLVLGCGEKTEYSKYITLGQYKGLEIEEQSIEVTDEEIEAQIESILQSASTTEEITDRDDVQSGDTANIDYVGTIDGEAFDGGTDTGYDLEIGSGTFIDGFEEQLIGVKVGETVDINVTFPEDYGVDSLNGQDAVFEVTVNSISKSVVPELNDEFVQANTDYSTVEEYKEGVRADLESSAEDSAETTKQDDVWSQVEENTTINDYPDDLIEKAKENVETSYGVYAEQYSMETDDFMQAYFGMTLEEYTKRVAAQEMICKEIAEKEGITVTSDEINVAAAEYAVEYGFEDSDSFIEEYGEDTIEDTLLWKKVLDFLVENAVIVDSSSTDEDTSVTDADSSTME